MEKIEGEGFNFRSKKIFEITKGQIKKYYCNGKIRFEGKYLNDMKWDGKFYDIDGNFVYEIKKGNRKE